MASLSPILLFFLEKEMEFFYEKIYEVRNIEKCFVDILSAGNLIHDTIECQRECDVKAFLVQLKGVVENIGRQETVNNANCLKLIEIATNHLSIFIIIDQLIRRFKFSLYNLDAETLKTAIYFEYEKMKSYMKVVNKIEKLQGQLMVLEKVFL